MLARISLAILVALGLHAQTPIYIRAGTPTSTHIVSPGCTGTGVTPMVCTLQDVSGLAAGDLLAIAGVCATDGLYNISAANGLRKIGAIVGSTISLQDNTGTPGVPDGVPIAGNGLWCTGGSSTGVAAPSTVGKMTALTTVPGPVGWFDGTNGDVTRKWALGTHNGLDNTNGIVCTLTTCTVTTTYSHACVGGGVGICAGDLITIWNSGSPTLSPAITGAEYTVLTAGTTTFTFASPSVSGNFTHNDHCGPGVTPNGTIQGTDNCTRISQLAISTNWAWQGALFYLNAFPPTPGTGAYRYRIDGGALTTESNSAAGFPGGYSTEFMLDQTRSDLLTAILYHMNNVEKMGGNNFFANEQTSDGGNYDLAGYTNTPYMVNFALAYIVVGGYMTSAEKQTFRDKVMNDISDPVPCVKNLPAPIAWTTGTGTAQAGSSSTITLASGANGTDGFYDNGVVEAVLAGGNHTLGLIASGGYVGATKVATLNGAWTNGVPTAGSTYNIWRSSTVTGTTMTGYGSHWNTPGSPDEIHAGDYLASMFGWGGAFLNTGKIGSYITAVNSDTSLTVVNGSELRASSTIPQTTWISHPWVTGNCGWQWVQNHWQGSPGSQPASYPPNGGQTTDGFGGNNGYPLDYSFMNLYIAFAPDDSRAAVRLAKISSPALDSGLIYTLGYSTGLPHSGLNYGFTTTAIGQTRMAWALVKNISGFPSLDTAGPWIDGAQKLKMFFMHPDKPFITSEHTRLFAFFGGNTNNTYASGCGPCSAIALDHGLLFNPNSATSKYLRNWLDNAMLLTSYQSVASDSLLELAVKRDPRIVSVDYRTQPAQYYFHDTSYAAAIPFGTPYPPTWHLDAVVSRTSGWAHPYDTHVFFRASSYASLDHDANQPGILDIYKAGSLLSNDHLFPDDVDVQSDRPEFTHRNPITEFGGANDLKNGFPNVSTATMPRWSGATAYGDLNSNYACSMGDLTTAWNTSLSRYHKYFCHFKKPGSEEIVETFTDIASNSSTIIRDQIYYPQNGQTIAGAGGGIIYDEGNTTYPGSGGCGSLNTNRTVLEQEDGGTSNGDPVRQYNLITKFLSPSTFTLNCDGSAYTDSNGAAERVSIYGGGSVGGTATSLKYFAVHKIATQPDTTLNLNALNPDASWTGGNTPATASLFPTDGALHSSITPVAVTLADPAQVFIGGLVAGAYTLTVGAFNCGSFTVVDGNNSIYCETTGTITGGTLSLNGAVASSTGVIVGGKVVVGGKLSVGH